MNDENARVLTGETLEKYLRLSSRTEHALSDSPVCRLVMEPEQRRLLLRTPVQGAAPDVALYDRIDLEIVTPPEEHAEWFELSVDAQGMAHEAYSLVMSIVFDLEKGMPFEAAVRNSIATYRDLLIRRRGLNEDQQVGLFGELAVLLHLIDSIGERDAMRAWLGPDSEEHDFALADADLEVKTTTGEARIHVISSATQLEQTGERPLHLVSLQVTAAGRARHGESLPQRVERVRAALHLERDAFETHLRALGWDDATADGQYPRRYLERSAPRCYDVDEEFPAIRRDALERVLARPELVVSLVYRIDVSGLARGRTPDELTGFC